MPNSNSSSVKGSKVTLASGIKRYVRFDFDRVKGGKARPVAVHDADNPSEPMFFKSVTSLGYGTFKHAPDAKFDRGDSKKCSAYFVTTCALECTRG